jgi:hypothetical protein
MTRVLILTLLILGLSASAVGAQNAPPGNSGVDQYLEAVPSTSGSTPTGGAKSGGSASGSVLTPTQKKALVAQGSDGEAVARLAQKYGTKGTGRKHKTRTALAADPPTSQSSNPSAFGALSRAVLPGADAGGMGPALPALLVAIAVSGAGMAVVRRHRSN